ncbi:MAG: 1-acyl-sn-glycerol-3-phosphate acyltransferase [Caulobacterales bacterium]|jgi:putative hemolysin|nr:1-acyl-sn-glycerol-3-phosphate acyltransferase [Caulobacterales bacterium]
MTQLDATATSQPAQEAAPAKHIVDVLIEERAPKLSVSPIWPLARPALYSVLNYDKAVRMADTIAPMGGREALESISQLLSVKLDISGLERVPRDGSFLILANHPTGITDGIALYDAVKTVRPDTLFYANSDAQRVCPRFDDVLIPVEWVLAKRTRERTRVTLKMTDEAFEQNRPLAIFPAGRLARMRDDGNLTDPEWMPTAVSLARKYELPIVPVHVSGPYAFWFHTFSKFSAELRDITLFHELLNKQGKTYKLTFGPLIPPAHANGDAVSITRRIKHYVERVLPAAPDAAYDPAGPECALRDPQGPNVKNRP